VVGPSPYKYASFRELRAVLGRGYIICRPCRRFVPLGRWLDDRDSRLTTFSCSVCGGDGAVVHEDSARDGLQHDPRPNPIRHQLAALRLQTLNRPADPFGRRAAAREELPQREKPYLDARPRFRPVPLPVRSFREAFDFGLELRLYCPGCHDWRPVALTAEQLDLRFANGRRFVCRRDRLKVYGQGTEVCGRTGEILFRPIERVTDRQYVDIQCIGRGRRFHTPWEISGVDLEAPPWAGRIDTAIQRFACPGCSGMARHTFHSPYPHKPTEPVTTS
jgi:hypothetical protein